MNQRAIDRLFERLSAVYGPAWERSLGATPVLEAKALWAHQLQAFADRIEAIVWALDELPESPPNVIQFRNLCRSAPAAATPRLPEPKADPARVAAELAKLGQLRTKPASTAVQTMKAWAYHLEAKDQAGHKISSYARKAYQEVVRHQAALQQRTEQLATQPESQPA
jgi:hypothetical protein